MRASILVSLLVFSSLAASSQVQLHRHTVTMRAFAEMHPHAGADGRAREWSDGRPDQGFAASASRGLGLPKVGTQSAGARPALPSRVNLTDVQIGSLDSIKQVTLAYDPGTGNLFSALLYTGGSTASGVAMYFSSDTGKTWVETAGFVSDQVIPGVSLTNAMGYFTVAGIYDSGRQVLMDRFFTADGSPQDTTFENPQVAFVRLAVNDLRRSLHRPTSTPSTTGCTAPLYPTTGMFGSSPRAIRGRRTSSNMGATNSPDPGGFRQRTTIAHHIGRSPISLSSIHPRCSASMLCRIRLLAWEVLGDSVRDAGRVSLPHADGTSMTALNDTVLVGYSPTVDGVTRVMLTATVDAGNGTGWSAESVSDTLAGSDAPVVTMESGNGLGVLYRYGSSPALLRFTSRASQTAAWNSPMTVSAIEPYLAPGALADLGNGVYGFVNLSLGSPVIQGAYFSTNVLMPVGVPLPPPYASSFELSQNYPNPFNPKTVISGQWTVDSKVRLAVYDVLGREVAVLANGRYPAGRYSFTFDGANLASGVYFYRLTAGSFSAVRKMLLVR